MKKIFWIVVFVAICSGLFFATFHSSVPITPPHLTPTPHTQLYPFSTPTQITIPKLHITSSVEQVGLDAKGSMDVPKTYQNIGWYKLGYRPGQKGSAVFAGHYDTPQGSPGVFYYLANLNPGDSIEVRDEQKHTLTYIVEKVTSYPLTTFPLQTVFANTDTYRLNLITCDGVFDKTKKLYDKRLVVFAVLQQ